MTGGLDFFVIGPFEKLFLEFLQPRVDPISGILLSTTDHLCDVLLELRLVGGLITKERVDGLNYHILQYRLIDGSCVAFLPGRLQPTDAAPDDGFAAAIVPVNSAYGNGAGIDDRTGLRFCKKRERSGYDSISFYHCGDLYRTESHAQSGKRDSAVPVSDSGV